MEKKSFQSILVCLLLLLKEFHSAPLSAQVDVHQGPVSGIVVKEAPGLLLTDRKLVSQLILVQLDPHKSISEQILLPPPEESSASKGWYDSHVASPRESAKEILRQFEKTFVSKNHLPTNRPKRFIGLLIGAVVMAVTGIVIGTTMSIANSVTVDMLYEKTEHLKNSLAEIRAQLAVQDTFNEDMINLVNEIVIIQNGHSEYMNRLTNVQAKLWNAHTLYYSLVDPIQYMTQDYLRELQFNIATLVKVSELIAQEGTSFLELRIKHLMKSNCIPQAMILAKLCAESSESSNEKCFRQSYITCLCTTLPNEDAIKEISKVDCREVLDIICNLETEGHDNTAFILCTTYLTQQIQTENIDCSWELTLFWSKLQRRLVPSLDTFLERCRQFGVIAKTLQHLFFLIRVVHAEAEEEGLAISILLCVRALQIKSDENDMKSSVCKTIACLLSHDLEVRRACQLTEFLLDPSEDAYNLLESLHLQPDQKFDEENAIVPNSLRCELLLALKAHWPFDPEFWDWKTLNRHCLKLLGKEASESEEHEDSEMVDNDNNVVEPSVSDLENVKEHQHLKEESLLDEVKEEKTKPIGLKKPVRSSERYQRWLQYKFHCLICNREVIEARILHHAKMHLEDGIYTCPVCIKKFKKKEIFVPHVMEHVKMPSRHKPKQKLIQKEKMNLLKKEKTSAISLTSFEQNNHLCKQTYDHCQYVTFRQLEDYNLQDRDLHPCPGTNCSRIFKQFKYLSVHLKAEHQNNDENAKHYLDIKNQREKCGFCRRHFITEFHLRDHEQVHVGPQPFMCVSIDCFARFSSVNELLGHKQMHDELEYKCELKDCNIVFSDLGQLYHHEAQHFRDASYACNFSGCKKFYFSNIEFQDHLTTHEANYAKVCNQETNKPAEDLALMQQENKLSAFNLINELDAKQSSNVLESAILSTDSSKSQNIPGIKKEPIADTNLEEEGGLTTPQVKQETLVERASLCALESQLAGSKSKTILDVPGSNNKFFVSKRLKEQFSFFSVTFDGKKFTCGFDGCGVSRKNTRGMHTHLRNDHPNHFKLKKRTGINARNFRPLFSGSQKSKLVRKLGARQELSDTFKRRLVCHTNSRMQRIVKGEMCQPIARARTLSSLPRVRRTEDAMVELLQRLKDLSLTNIIPLVLSSTSLQKPLSETLQSFPSTCVTSPDLAVSKSIVQRTAAEQEAFTNQCLLRLAAKPFFCELQGCKYAFVTRDALLVHYLRKHNYPKESVLQFSMFKDKYAPFQCHMCHRAFTRRTHLRIHYRKKHQLGKVKLPKKLFSTKKRGLNMGVHGHIENILNRSPNTCSTAFRSSEVEEFDDDDDDEDDDMFEQQMKPDMSHFKREHFSETDETLSGDEVDYPEDSQEEDLELGEVRESKKIAAKGDLCYISDRCNKPFHCVHKGCNSSFTNQPALNRHYRIVHHYSKEELCLEKGKTKSKRDLAKYKKIFVCKYQDCNKRFLCSEGLAKHCSDIHNLYNGDDETLLSINESARFSCDQPKCPAVFYTFDKLKHHQMEDHTEVWQNKELEIPCEINGCYRIFPHNTAYSEHVYHSHKECYDDIFGKRDVVTGTVLPGNNFVGQKKPNLVTEKCQFLTNGNKMKKTERQFVKRNDKKVEAVDFRAREEAVNMCLEEVKHTQFPCMVHGCLSVVKLESSIVRHYKRSHLFSDGYIEKHYQKLVICVKYGMRDKGESHLEIHAKKHYMQGNKRRKKCVIESGRQLMQNDFHYQDKENENYSRNTLGNEMFNTDAFICKSMLKYNHNSHTSFEDSKIEQNQPESSGKEHKSYFSSYQLPLNRKNESEDWERNSAHRDDTRFTVHAGKDNCQKQLNRTFDLKSFKPMGFESSFLKFIQEREQKDDYLEDQVEWVPEKYCAPSFVKNAKDNQNNFEYIQGGRKAKSASEPLLHGHVTTCHPLATASESTTAPSLEDLRAILDKALTDCGDLALKQLRYQRPVVVLERSKFSSPFVDLFPAKKTERLCVGST